MPPYLALFLWFVLLIALLWFDPAKERKMSSAIWVPVIWIFIVGSRLPSQWLGYESAQAAQALEEGNPMDRIISFGLIVLAIGILTSRSFRWADFLAKNTTLAIFVGFALISVCWSDYPFVTFKRWIRDLGNYLVILIALSDDHPFEAIRMVLRRVCYLLIPLSIVLIKYYSYMGIHYSSYTGEKEYVGVGTSKNMLGVVCLVSGLFFFWDTVTRWSKHIHRRTKQVLLVNAVFMAITLWLLNLSNSATSRVCLALGCLVIAGVHTAWCRRHPTFLKALIPGAFSIYVILALAFDINGQLAPAVGRDPTLHDRTKIWQFLLGMHTNPVIGTGYESFWLGPRLQWFWERSGLGAINEAHNGYLDVYLTLGLIGVSLLILFLIASYSTICKRLASSPALASLGLAVWTVLVFYNMSEAAFQVGLPWMMLLMTGTATGIQSRNAVRSPAAYGSGSTGEATAVQAWQA